MQRYTRFLFSASLFAGALLVGESARASTQAGQINVTVKDAAGAALAGVQLEITSADLMGSRKGETDEEGHPRFTQLPPGTYQVQATLAEYSAAKVTEVGVHIGGSAAVDIAMQALDSANVEEILITGTKRPTVDTERLSLGVSLTDAFVENLPTPRSYQSVVLMVPGVVDPDGSGNANFLGATDNNNQYLLDGINITDPVTNTFSANFNFDAIKEVEVLTAGRDAEYGNAAGGIVNIVTKSGGNEMEGDVSLFYRSQKTQFLLEKGEGNLVNSNYELNGALGGPLVLDKLWYFASFEVPWSRSTLPAPENGPAFADVQGSHPTRDFLGFYGLGKVTWQVSDEHTVKLLVQSDPTRIRYVRQENTVHPDAEREQDQGGLRVALTDELFLSDSLFWNNRIAYSRSYVNSVPMSGNYDLAGRTNSETGTSTINDTAWTDDQRTRVQAHSSLAYTVDELMGEHQFKFGIDAQFTRQSTFNSIPGGGYYTDKGVDPNDPSSGIGLPYQYDQLVTPQDTSISGDAEGLFVQDVWKPFENFTIRPGLRFDSARLRNWEGETQVAINTVSPRIGIAWDPFNDGKMSLRAGYYQYVETGYLSLSSFAGGNAKLVRTYEYNPSTEKYDIFVREIGGASGNVGKEYLKDPWNQQRPRTHEFILGAGRELWTNLGIDATFTYRYSGNGWEDDEVNVLWNEKGNDAVGFANGERKYIFSLGALEEAFIRYYGMQVAITKSFADSWDLMASYAWSKTEGTQEDSISAAFDNPRMRDYEFGSLPQDIRHVLKIDGSYAGPRGVVVGAAFSFFSGAPYNRLYLNDYYGGYSDFRAPRGFELQDDGSLKELRLPARFVLDMRVQWQLEELTGHKLDLILEGKNLLAQRTTTKYEERNLASGSAKWGDVIDKMNPLSAKVGVRYRF